MPEFTNPFAGKNCEKKLSADELIRAIRFSIASEYEAIQIYDQIANSTDDKMIKQVLKDIADEEKVHAGEFLKVLKILSPAEFEFYAQGRHEVEEKFLQ